MAVLLRSNTWPSRRVRGRVMSSAVRCATRRRPHGGYQRAGLPAPQRRGGPPASQEPGTATLGARWGLLYLRTEYSDTQWLARDPGQRGALPTPFPRPNVHSSAWMEMKGGGGTNPCRPPPDYCGYSVQCSSRRRRRPASICPVHRTNLQSRISTVIASSELLCTEYSVPITT